MKAKSLLRVLLCFSLFLGVGYQSFATHLRAGEITVERISCNSLDFIITITVFTNTKNTTVKFGGDPDLSYLYFGDGERVFVPETDNTIRYDLDPEGSIATASFTVRHHYSSYQQYKISYQEPNRNAGVQNMDNSVNTLFYIETVINLDPYLDFIGGCSSSPRLLVPPIDKACTGATWTHNPGAYDPDKKDSISYEMVIPNSAENTNVVNYRDPNAPKFYGNYNTANEDQNGPPTWGINAVTGTITWDAPGRAGEYNIAFIVKEWRKIEGIWRNLGFVRRDMQIIVEDCDNKRPQLIIPNELCVEAGTLIDVPIRATDPDGDSVKIEAFSPIFQYPPAQGPATMVPAEPKFHTQPLEVRFKWQTECFHVQEQPYQVVFKATDSPPKGRGAHLATFETWTIKVVGPAPKWTDAVLTSATQSVDLSWEPYVCSNAEQIQVWRRVDSNPFTHADCETGMPAGAGYTLIETMDIRQNGAPVTTYTDTNDGQGLSPAAKYCYRLVAVFPGGTESYVSDEICIGPLKATAPIITNVSVEKTSTTDGQIFVKWTSPFDLDKTAFPRPFTYKIYRGNDFAGPVSATPLNSVAQSDTTFTDTGLNTEENVYNYKVEAYYLKAGVLTKIDSASKAASSVRVEARSLLNQIQLDWSATVPWSNQISSFPNRHLIYRGPEGATDDQLVLIDSVDVQTQGFTYTDGVTTPLQDNLVYCYRIQTRGGYGNPAIPQPLKNFSQKICAQPGDETPPCKPATPVAASGEPCESYLDVVNCGQNSGFENKLTWDRPEEDTCRNDISYYKVYAANSTTADYVLLATNIRTTEFTDSNLPSFARCYKISAVDRSGNESELSEPVCFDNCPYYELPNVFTPNMDDCNQKFSAYSGNDRYKIASTDPEAPPTYKCGGVIDERKCARFVERVIFRVYNRWGKEVYSYTGASNDDQHSIYLDWDGRADDGSDLASGVYYYVAEVTFTVVDPAKKDKTIKGWVHLIR